MQTPENRQGSSRSQVEVREIVRKTADEFGQVLNAEDLLRLRDFLFVKIAVRPYNQTTWQHEKSIRWRRTASEILEDGYIYDTKWCTDVVITFCALCRAMNLDTRFLKLVRNDGRATHSAAEIRLTTGWFFFDVAVQGSEPKLWEMDEQAVHGVWRLWGKGRDAWSLV